MENEVLIPNEQIVISQEEAQELLQIGLSQEQDLDMQETDEQD
ncbi:hypothetical protein [Helicobacter cinaedi]|nr:hypothetical protein [Helicobacter cinaedi]